MGVFKYGALSSDFGGVFLNINTAWRPSDYTVKQELSDGYIVFGAVIFTFTLAGIAIILMNRLRKKTKKSEAYAKKDEGKFEEETKDKS